jgi:uncharacterized protein
VSFERLNEVSDDLITEVDKLSFVRSRLFDALAPPKQNVVILKGARGIGKSTLIQQFLSSQQKKGNKVLYLSADSTLLDVGLAKLAHEYQKRGGIYLALDEIHKYDNWQSEVKTILDSFPGLKLIVSGSSSTNLDYASTDLSRRHIMLHAKGLSFREYLEKNQDIKLRCYSLKEILTHPKDISQTIIKIFKERQLDLLSFFKKYLREGYFLSRENYEFEVLYYDSLLNTINGIIDVDLPYAHKAIDGLIKQKIKLLLKHVAAKCPFTPNISELSKSLSIANDNTLKKYLYYLSEAEVLINLYQANKSHKDFQRPQKIFLNNTNYAYAYEDNPVIGTVRETFAANCLKGQGELTAPTFGDFCLNGEWVFEIGGRSKNKRQIKSVKQGYVFADDITSVEHGNLPLWLLGFLW